MPGSIDVRLNSSDHLHRMVELVAGMGADPHIRTRIDSGSHQHQQSPQERLKTALSSSKDFLRNYLEITELTMGTYKHIGYIRSARLIGKELAQLYLYVFVYCLMLLLFVLLFLNYLCLFVLHYLEN